MTLKIIHVTWPRPFQVWFVIYGLGLAAINLPSICEVPISTHYEDMKSDTKYRKWVH